MKGLSIFLLSIVIFLQYKLWFEGHGVRHLWDLQQEIATQTEQNKMLKQKNALLSAEITSLKTAGAGSVEERARSDLGMIRKGEQYYQIVSPTRS